MFLIYASRLAIYLKKTKFSTIFLNHIFIIERNASYCMAPLQVNNISVDCDMLADDTTLHTSGKKIFCKSEAICKIA